MRHEDKAVVISESACENSTEFPGNRAGLLLAYYIDAKLLLDICWTFTNIIFFA
jgi:hypothetical protein